MGQSRQTDAAYLPSPEVLRVVKLRETKYNGARGRAEGRDGELLFNVKNYCH